MGSIINPSTQPFPDSVGWDGDWISSLLELWLTSRSCTFISMDQKFAKFDTLNQKDKGAAYLSLLSDIFTTSNGPQLIQDIHILVDHVVNQDNAGFIVGRQVLSELVKILNEGGISNLDLRKQIVEDILATVQPRLTSYEEQVSARSQRHTKS